MSETLKTGERIVYLGKMGATEHPDSTKYCATVEEGSTGVYIGKLKGKLGKLDWHMTQAPGASPDAPPLFVAVHLNQFRRATAGRD